jgi:hypothetical protein
MNTLGQLGGGGAVVGIWSRLWTVFKFGIGAGLVIVTVAETYIIVTDAAYVRQIKGGEAAQGTAQTADPGRTIRQYRAGMPVTGADALVGVEVAGKDAGARKDTADADAMNESEESLLAKKAAGEPLTTTEQLMLIKLETVRQELRAKAAGADREAAEAKIKQAEASAAGAKASADITSSNFTNCVLGGANSFGDLAGRSLGASFDMMQGRNPCAGGRRQR